VGQCRGIIAGPQESKNLAVKFLIIAARVGEEGLSLIRSALERGLEETTNMLEPLGSHRHTLLSPYKRKPVRK
jgi:hypothetical protein